MGKQVTRLYRQFQPDNYDLTIKPDAENMVFEGEVIITGKKTGPPSQRITLHQKDLKIHSVEVEQEKKTGTEKVGVSRTNNHKAYDELRLHSKSTLYPGNYRIIIKFSGKITKHMHGLYPCPFKHMGKQKVLLATQFESHHAREVFPCVDEPEAKATFDLTLITPKKQKVLANTPIKKQADSHDKNWVETLFETSPKMSTYLLAFAIGEIHGVSAESKSGVTVTSWATVAQPKSFLEYANKEAIQVLDFFTGYFKTPFPLPKLDQIALPDFESGAMENWGLITYREAVLLADPVNRSVSSEQRISEVISHELSHQWFGNLVTMKWWDDLWLNESFATMMAYIAMDNVHSDWKVWDDFISDDAIAASNKDIYKDVQSVGVEVKHPDEIYTIFDPAIVYAKGGRLLKMLLDYIGEEAFRNGLREYFKKHAYKNTIRDDLWKELSASSKSDIEKLMTPWLEKPGLPMLSVSGSNSQTSISQQRFLLDGEDNDSLWPVPLLADTKLPIDRLDKKSRGLGADYSDVVFNANGSGHFIVNYREDKTKDSLNKRIANQEISSPGRINAINDTLLLSRKGEYLLTDAIDLIKQCKKEPRDSVWSIMCRALGLASTLTESDETCEKQIRKIKNGLSEHWYKKLGWDDKPSDDLNTKLLRTTILSLKVSSESDEAINTALAKFKAAKNVEALPAEHRAIIAGAEVRFSNQSNIKSLFNEYVSAQNPEVQYSIAAALCSTKDRKTGQKIIDWALSGNGNVRDQDIPRWFAYLMRNRHTRQDAWSWLTDDWDKIQSTFGKGIDHFLVYASGPLSTPKEQKQFAEFFEPKKDIVILKRAILVANSAIDARVKWRQQEEPKLKKYLAQ